MTPPRLVVLDLAGTTLDDGGAILDAFDVALTRVGIEHTRADLNAVRGANKLHVFRTFAARAFGPGARAVDAAREGLAIFDEELRVQFRDGDIAPFPGVTDALAAMRTAGLALAANSGLQRPLLEALQRRFRWLGELFDALVCGDDVPAGRPAPYMIHLAMERTGTLTVGAVVAVGDTPLDLQAGTNAGAGGVVGVLTGTHDARSLGAIRHTHLIPSVAELPALLAAEFGVEALASSPSTA